MPIANTIPTHPPQSHLVALCSQDLKQKYDEVLADDQPRQFDAILMSTMSIMTLGDMAIGRVMILVGLYQIHILLYEEVRVQAKRIAQSIGERILNVEQE